MKTIVLGYTIDNCPSYWKNFITQLADSIKGYEDYPLVLRLKIVNEVLQREFDATYEHKPAEKATITFATKEGETLFMLKFV